MSSYTIYRLQIQYRLYSLLERNTKISILERNIRLELDKLIYNSNIKKQIFTIASYYLEVNS